MISSFAAVVYAPWTAATITFADAEIVMIGKNCLKRRKVRTTVHCLDSVLRKLVIPGYRAYHHSQCHYELPRAAIAIKKELPAYKNVLRGVVNLRAHTTSTPHPQIAAETYSFSRYFLKSFSSCFRRTVVYVCTARRRAHEIQAAERPI